MYHRIRLLTRPLTALHVIASVIGVLFAFYVLSNAAARAAVGTESAAIWPLPPGAKAIKRSPVGVELYELDDSALGSRRPLLMVHGLRGELSTKDFRWQKVCAYLNNNPEFKSRYKVFLARYNTYVPISPLAPKLGQIICKLYADVGGKPVSIVALSMGGNLVAEAMTDTHIAACVDKVLTMGTPFHGSPLFTYNWMEYSMLRSHITPLTQLDTIMPYGIYFSKHINLLTDLNWDNSDRLLPDVGIYRAWYDPLRQKPLDPKASSNPNVLQFNAQSAVDKSKFIVYGGYLNGRIAEDVKQPLWLSAIKAPFWFATTTVPEHTGREHAVLRSLHRQIAYAFVLLPQYQGKFVYGLNDGITPLVSSLFLPNAHTDGADGLAGSDVQRLRTLTDVRRARVFGGIDHITFIDGYRPHGAPKNIVDELSGSATARPMFAWILEDLLSDGQGRELASDPKQK